MLLPAIRFHILTPFLVGKLVVLPPFRGAILPFEKNAEDDYCGPIATAFHA